MGHKRLQLADIKWAWPLCLRKKNVGVSEMLDGSLKLVCWVGCPFLNQDWTVASI